MFNYLSLKMWGKLTLLKSVYLGNSLGHNNNFAKLFNWDTKKLCKKVN